MPHETKARSRALCLLLAVIMLLSVFPLSVSAAADYTIRVAGGISKCGSSQVYRAAPGTTVTLTAGNSTTGRAFYKWEVVSPAGLTLADEKSATTTFKMPGEEVEVRAIFKSSDKVMTSEEFVAKAVDVAKNYKTLYVLGCFGAPLNANNKKRYIESQSYNAQPDRAAMINAATDDTFGFDCVCFIKGLLWGWNGDTSRVYGGAAYVSNGVPDINTEAIINVCSKVTDSFNHSTMLPGELVWMTGHVGVYIGNGLAVECTPKWDNCVQITACNMAVSGYNQRNWSKHGLLPYIDYGANSEADLDQSTIPDGTREFTVDVPATASYVGEEISYSGSKHFNSEKGPGYVRAVFGTADGQKDPKRAYKVTMDYVVNDLSVGDSIWKNDEGVIMAMLGSGKTMGYNIAQGTFFITNGGGGWNGNPNGYIAQVDGNVETGRFYRFEYIVEPDSLTLKVNGMTVVTADVKDAFSPDQYFIFYPKHVDMDILMAKVEYLDGSTVSDMSGRGVLDAPHWNIHTPAAYPGSDGMYKVTFRGYSDAVQTAIDAIDSIGEVHCRELIRDASYNGVQYKGYGYDPADGYTRFTGNSKEPFYVSFDFSISSFDPGRARAGFGGVYRTRSGAVFAGYDFNSGSFTIRNNYWSDFVTSTPLVYSSKAQKLETGRLYKMRAEFASDGIRLYVDGELVCSTGIVSWNGENWYSFLPGGCDANIADFEYGSLSGKVYYNMSQMRGKGFFSPDNHYVDNVSFTANTVLDSGAAISKAERLYAALSDAEKKGVTNYDRLTAARARYNELLSTVAPLYGDANGDGEVNTKDIVTLREYLANLDFETGVSTVEISGGADANGDGEVNMKDIVLLGSYLANYDYESEESSVVLGPQK